MIKVQYSWVMVMLSLACLCDVITSQEDKIKETMQKMVKECQTKTGASDADLDALRARKRPETKEGLCLFNCFFEHFHVMQDGVYNQEGLEKTLTFLMQGSDETKLAKMKEMTVSCGKELKSGVDKCENGRILMDCTVNKGKEFGFEYPINF